MNGRRQEEGKRKVAVAWRGREKKRNYGRRTAPSVRNCGAEFARERGMYGKF